MRVEGYNHFGGRHVESANLKNLLAHAGIANPYTGQPLTEALCFGIAGGIGAGYSFCPSVPRYGTGSGVSVVGRYKIYATDATWYQGFFDRIGARTHVTETGGPGKAHQNLVGELQAGRPAVVWCSQPLLPFLGRSAISCGLWMHTFVVYAIDEAAGLVHGADRAATRVTLTLDELVKARNGICSHKNRTLTFEPPKTLTKDALRSAVRAGLQACVQEMVQPRMKTFSLPGLELWAKMIVNDKNKDGWLKVFNSGLMFCALRDVFDSIETAGTGGGLYRAMFADFLDEAASVANNRPLTKLAGRYRELAGQWTELAEAALPGDVKPFKQARELLRKSCRLFEEEGEKAARPLAETTARLGKLEADTRAAFPLKPDETRGLLEGLRERVVALHQAECDAAKELQQAVK
jgi:hypothetical protein